MNHSASKVVAVDTESKLQLFAEHADSMPGLIAVVVWGFAPSLAELPRKNGSVIRVCAATPSRASHHDSCAVPARLFTPPPPLACVETCHAKKPRGSASPAWRPFGDVLFLLGVQCRR